jgi:hypothetical protein
MAEKVCRVCELPKDLETGFSKSPACKDGHEGTCKECRHKKYKETASLKVNKTDRLEMIRQSAKRVKTNKVLKVDKKPDTRAPENGAEIKATPPVVISNPKIYKKHYQHCTAAVISSDIVKAYVPIDIDEGIKNFTWEFIKSLKSEVISALIEHMKGEVEGTK